MGQKISFVSSLGSIFRRGDRKAQDNIQAVASDIQIHQVAALSRQLEEEKRRNAQLIILHELSQQLETLLDQPVAGQLAVNTLERGIECSYVCLYLRDAEQNEFVVLASAGRKANLIPPGYRQSIVQGIAGRAARLRKTQIASDIRLDPDYLAFEREACLSTLAVPLIHNGYLKGVLKISADEVDAFRSSDVMLAEAVAGELTRAWERSGYHQHLTELIRAGISLSTMIDPQEVVRELAVITKQALNARFTYVTLLDQAGNFMHKSHSGHAPRLLKYIERTSPPNNLLKATLKASQAFRIRDIRRSSLTLNAEIDNSGLRSALAIPIRLHRLSIGAILAFGKEDEIFFTENDESLGSLLSSQSAAAVESTWLYQELRNTLATTTQLYQVSFQVLQTEELGEAVKVILETAGKITKAGAAGVMLFSADNKIEVQKGLDANGISDSVEHPLNLIEQAMSSGTSIFLSDQTTTQVCFPIQSHLRKFGAMWLKIPESLNYDSRHTAALQTLANQLERAVLLNESRKQAKEIEAAYQELEISYVRTLAALTSALDARDRETEGHSLRVSQIACRLGEFLGLDARQVKAMERGSLLHDIGKIGISDAILHKPGPLDELEWKIMRTHPAIGAHIVEGIPFLQDAMVVIRYHQERWDGSGYPAGLRGKDIPFLARIFAVVDAFDALSSDRPYRPRISAEEAVRYIHSQAGILFDPGVVAAFEKLIHSEDFADIFITR